MLGMMSVAATGNCVFATLIGMSIVAPDAASEPSTCRCVGTAGPTPMSVPAAASIAAYASSLPDP